MGDFFSEVLEGLEAFEKKFKSQRADATDHSPGALRVFRVDCQTGLRRELIQVEPGETFQCGRKIQRFILGDPDDLILCKRHAEALGYY